MIATSSKKANCTFAPCVCKCASKLVILLQIISIHCENYEILLPRSTFYYLKNFTMNWFDGKICLAVNFLFFHTVSHSLVLKLHNFTFNFFFQKFGGIFVKSIFFLLHTVIHWSKCNQFLFHVNQAQDWMDSSSRLINA